MIHFARTLGFGNLASLAGADSLFADAARGKLERLLAELVPLAARYDVVVANPPYMGSNNMNKWLADWTKRAYPDSKRDLCTCFIERGQNLSIDRGYEALITSDTCMYISSFEQLRKNILSRSTIVCFIDTRGTNAHPDVFDANAGWVLHNAFVEGVKGSYFKLNQAIAAKEAGYLEALANPDCGWRYSCVANNFDLIPGSPIAYWATDTMYSSFQHGKLISKYAWGCNGLTTGDNNKFLRIWHEVSMSSIALAISERTTLQDVSAWVPYNKGGDFQKWASHHDFIINWKQGGKELVDYGHLVMRSAPYMLKPALTWSKISSGRIAMRNVPQGFMFDVAGLSLFPEDAKEKLYFEALINSTVANSYLSFLSPTLNFEVGNVTSIPVVGNPCLSDGDEQLVFANHEIVESYRDSFEQSWQFKKEL